MLLFSALSGTLIYHANTASYFHKSSSSVEGETALKTVRLMRPFVDSTPVEMYRSGAYVRSRS